MLHKNPIYRLYLVLALIKNAIKFELHNQDALCMWQLNQDDKI